MSKPEVVAYRRPEDGDALKASCMSEYRSDYTQPLIRLADHEAAIADLQAENQRLLSAGQALEADYSSYRREVEHKQQAYAADKARLDSGCIMTNERDEFGHEYQCQRRGLNLRERIDAALAQQGEEGET